MHMYKANINIIICHLSYQLTSAVNADESLLSVTEMQRAVCLQFSDLRSFRIHNVMWCVTELSVIFSALYTANVLYR